MSSAATAGLVALGILCRCAWAVSAQSAAVIHVVNLRVRPSTRQPPTRLLANHEVLILVAKQPVNGFYHVRAADRTEGWVWARSVRLVATPVVAAPVSPTDIRLHTPTPGSAGATGCADGLWKRVYIPQRLLIEQDCLTVTGVIVDATASERKHEADGVRREGDGDSHGWLKVDPQFSTLISAGNISSEGGNLVFELVCRNPSKYAAPRMACAGYTDVTKIPPVGTHVAITGTLVQDTNHGSWREIHPVSRIKAQ